MKKVYTLFSLLFMVIIAKAQFPSPYCAEAYSSGVEPITSVVLGSINNQSSDATGGSPHEDYTSISTTLTAGNSYTITVQGNTDGNYSDYVRVFIDWNQDGDFLDAGEQMNIGIIKNSTGLDTISVSGTITVPVLATVGSTRMRVSKKWSLYQSPCNTSGFGESEDYTIDVAASPSCTGTPPTTSVTAPPTFCMDSMMSLSLTGITAGTGLTFQWQSSNAGANTWTNIAGATVASPSVQMPLVNTDFRCIVTCTSSSLSTNSNAVTVNAIYCGPPKNDECDSAFVLTANTPLTATTVHATQSMAASTCGGTADDDVWFSFVAQQTATKITLTTTTTFDAVVVGYSGACGGLTELNCADATASGGTEVLNLTGLTIGDTYYVRIYSYGSSATAQNTFILNMTASNAPINDVCDSAFVLNYNTPLAGTTIDATQSMAASSCGGTADDDVWYSFVAQQTATKITLTTTTSFDAVVAGYSGTCGSFTELDCADAGFSGGTEVLNLTGLTIGDTYYVRVYSYSSAATAQNTFTLNMTASIPPINDVCDSAFVLNYNTPLAGTTVDATQSLAASTCNGLGTGTADDDVWYTFTASQSGTSVVILTPDSTTASFDAAMVAYSGGCASPAEIGCADATAGGGKETLTLQNLNVGDTYLFRVYSYGSSITSQGNFTLTLLAAPNPPDSCATNIYPPDAAIDIPVNTNVTFKWTPIASATSYDLYGGTSNPPTGLVGNFTADSAVLTIPGYSTTYYWYVVPKNIGGGATGCDAANVTSFTTEAAPPAPVNDLPCDAISLALNGPSDCQNTASATTTGDPSSFGCSTLNNTTWYKYTATSADSVLLTFAVPTTGFLHGWVGVYTATGSCPGALTFTDVSQTIIGGCKEFGAAAGDSTTIFMGGMTAGTDYYIIVDGFSGAVGQYCCALRTANPVPVRYTNLSVEKNRDVNVLNWTTNFEQNNRGFEVQKGIDANKLNTVSFVESKATNGNSSIELNYQFIDTKPYAGITYYRLKQIDKNGKVAYSNVVSVKGNAITNLSIINVYPNPANSKVNLVIAAPKAETTTIVITDMLGKIVNSNTKQLVAGNNEVAIAVNNLANGTYMLRVICNNGCQSEVVKFVKN